MDPARGAVRSGAAQDPIQASSARFVFTSGERPPTLLDGVRDDPPGIQGSSPTDVALALTAIEPLPRGDWLGDCQRAIESIHGHVHRRGTNLLAWRDTRRAGRLHYADGWSIGRLWLSSSRWALGITSKRLYFQGEGTELDERPEHVVVSGRRPASPVAAEATASHWELVRVLREGFGASATPVPLEVVDADLASCQEVQIGERSFAVPVASLESLYRAHGFDMVPEGFTVSVCPLESVTVDQTNRFVQGIVQAVLARNARVKVRVASVPAVQQRLGDLTSSDSGVAAGHCVLFVMPSQKAAPGSDSLALFRALEASRVPFRRAYADDPVEFSIPNQLSSLLMAAGGTPHRSRTKADGEPVWSVAVDLSSGADRARSVLALTLVDPDGRLRGAWTAEQPRDETARTETLSTLLELCRGRLAALDTTPRILVLRDGRLFENENFRLFRGILRTDVTLVEYRKRGNPQIVQIAETPNAIRAPLAATVLGTSAMFIITAPPRNERTLASVVKVVCNPEWNGLGLGSGAIARLLAVSATAPALGPQRHTLPAAIYWADGIAGANDLDLRFRGIPVHRFT